MIRPLTKRKKDQTLYTRRPHVEQALGELALLDMRTILERTSIVVLSLFESAPPRPGPSRLVVFSVSVVMPGKGLVGR